MSEVLFVKQVESERRRRVQAWYVSPDEEWSVSSYARERFLNGCRVGAASAITIGACGMYEKDISWGYRCAWTYTVWCGFLLWALLGVLDGILSLKKSGIGATSAKVHAVCMLALLVLATLSLGGYTEARTDAVFTTVFAGGLLFNALLVQIYFRSFSGLYAPIWPRPSAPTVLPIFATNLLAAAVYCACVGMQFQPPNLTILRLLNAFRIGAWVLWLLAAWAYFNVIALTCDPRLRHDPRIYKPLEKTPLTKRLGTPNLVR
ncbi:putative transmembrane protein [Gregarina niphandrodes]|uniref:Transmembrane protein n=1 Tax=Gregarina niphandrodes TaxID=110365 RepID=A0A023AZ36_GRENI|nr:putative transmembrane protein [Gregarina niphandrodes]EZG43869.1 putative transmembrane protein [Gregarina niphandrodes]|eukprot:XP_011132957.1 putative transmembrane protein [Gregarina niphandrodes]